MAVSQGCESLGLLGVGAFGKLAAPYLAKHFNVVFFDPIQDLRLLAEEMGARAGTLAEAASCDVVVLAMPIQKLDAALRDVAPHLLSGAVVIDVVSVKVKPKRMMELALPTYVDIVGTHPLFGPQSGKNGIAGLTIAVCNARGDRGEAVAKFCAEKLGLNVVTTTAEEHDRQMAYVQGLTHLLAKIVVSLNLPDFSLKTKTYAYLQSMVDMVRYDSEELFKAIERENPYVAEAKNEFFEAARSLEARLSKD
ncbi:MAG: prephenate dehydrogenase/arogenate dehydrogenase family protein [Bdellovibrionales bacterium]